MPSTRFRGYGMKATLLALAFVAGMILSTAMVMPFVAMWDDWCYWGPLWRIWLSPIFVFCYAIAIYGFIVLRGLIAMALE